MGKFPILAVHALPLRGASGCVRPCPLGQWSASWLAGWPALSPSFPTLSPDPTQPFTTDWPAWLLFLHVQSFPWKLWLIELLSKWWIWFLSPCSPGSQAGSILPLATLREGFEQPQQRTSQKLPIEQLGWERKPAAPSRNSRAQRLGTRAGGMWELTLTELYQSFRKRRRK